MDRNIRQGIKFLFVAMHILPPVGGAERSMLTLMYELRRLGHTVNHIDINNYDKELEKTARYHDVIITQLQWTPSAVALAEKYNKPCMVLYRSLEPVCRVVHDKNLSYLQATCGQKCKTCPHKITGYEKDGLALHKADMIIGNSKWTAGWLAEEHGHSPDKLGWMYPAIDMSFLAEENKKKEFISMSMWTYPAGTDVFADIARLMPTENFRIYGYTHNLPSYPQYTLPKNVEFIENAPQEEMFGATKLWLFPYRTVPNFGRVVIEAQEAGIPVVGIKAGAIVEDNMIIDNVTGYHVDGHDPKKWVKYVKKALSNLPQLKENISKEDFSKFKKQENTERFIKYTTQVLNKKRN